MKKLLFIDACLRGKASRSLRLAHKLLSGINTPNIEIETVDLAALQLSPLSGEIAEQRSHWVTTGELSHPELAHALQFAQADAVVIAAPFWDLSFPSALRVYLERLFVVGLTFHYDASGQTVGDCKPGRLVYVTTRGGYVSATTPDFAVPYLKAMCHMLGVAQFDCLAAEGLDIAGNDAEALLREAEAQAQSLASHFWTAEAPRQRRIL